MNGWHLLSIRLQMESLITEREAMKAMNEHRAMQGLAQAYGEEAFVKVQGCFEALINDLRAIGA